VAACPSGTGRPGGSGSQRLDSGAPACGGAGIENISEVHLNYFILKLFLKLFQKFILPVVDPMVPLSARRGRPLILGYSGDTRPCARFAGRFICHSARQSIPRSSLPVDGSPS
jgi:hypothetical protein